MASLGKLFAALGLALLSSEVGAHVFKDEPLPTQGNLEEKAIIYVRGDEPELHLRDIRLHGGGKVKADVHLVLVPWKTKQKFNDTTKLMECKVGGVEDYSLSVKPGVYSWALTDSTLDMIEPLEAEGRYLLAVAVCGEAPSKGVKLSGSVVVKGANGFLGGLESWRLPVYGFFSLVGVSIGVVWAVVLFQKSEQVNQLHHLIAWLLLLGALEPFTYWWALGSTNSTGQEGQLILVAEYLSLTKGVFTLLVLSRFANGIGFGGEESTCLSLTGTAIQTLYIVLSGVKNCVLKNVPYVSEPDRYQAFMVSAGQSLVFAVLLGWALVAMGSRLQEAKKQDSEMKLKVYTRMAILAILALIVGAVSMVGQLLLDRPGLLVETWREHVFWEDGLSQAFFLTACCLTMWILCPQEGLDYAPLGSPTADKGPNTMEEGDNEEDTALFVVGGEGHGEEEPDVEGQEKSAPVPDTIGAGAVE